MSQPINTLAGSGVILVQPKYPENIGASARIACNFGIEQLTVVADEAPDQERMLKMATHKAAHLIHALRVVGTTREAAEPYHFIVGTTARQGKNRVLEHTPSSVMQELAPLAAQHNHIALMFGPESSGLTNEDLDYCQFFSTIPTADFSSLNLAQAVAIHCYELSQAMSRLEEPENLGGENQYANSYDLEGMYEHIEEALTRITFIRHTNKTYWMRNIRHFLSRTRLKKKEASLIRGVCRKFLWHSGQEGLEQQEIKNGD
ncbi:MAG: TrmH family RNA methyltransferase [Candidatus Electrothrix aestuarii]|uniref:TrmH family RNA methyltransferase n=1 Tax=Candidatus Electrothrix aestuarii TaxID=3062594 RepID=A0AAU8LW50_9BACT|nr:TrmH family RNA methyltransferase [Candidatus Electrothrix aestuarii]WPD22423.1 MAG: TrmH family RNA methyltransferase [Candidatus Electrothrix sp. GW3-3]